jgi:dTDP-4-amino-4,6-dideoxygalactose transaminase
MIPFNRPYLTGNESKYINKVLDSRKLSGDGEYSKKCQSLLQEKFGFRKTLLTTSCTDALEMCAILLNIQPGDEVIVPSYTFVSTANAFALRGAKLIFADSQADQPNIDPAEIERLISTRTKAIVVVHYAGVACDMDRITAIAEMHNIAVVEDAAQAIDSYHRGRPLGSIGALAAFSFHETKNIVCGEGGLLTVNKPEYDLRAEIIREKGTNRSSFFRGEVDKYGWVDVGSSFLPSDLLGAFLYAQIESIAQIQTERVRVWSRYFKNLAAGGRRGWFGLPVVPAYATNNAHMFYLVCRNIEERTQLIDSLKSSGVSAVFHYLSLHSSPYFASQHDGRVLANSDRYTECLVRLPLFPELTNEQVDQICEVVMSLYSHACIS